MLEYEPDPGGGGAEAKGTGKEVIMDPIIGWRCDGSVCASFASVVATPSGWRWWSGRKPWRDERWRLSPEPRAFHTCAMESAKAYHSRTPYDRPAGGELGRTRLTNGSAAKASATRSYSRNAVQAATVGRG